MSKTIRKICTAELNLCLIWFRWNNLLLNDGAFLALQVSALVQKTQNGLPCYFLVPKHTSVCFLERKTEQPTFVRPMAYPLYHEKYRCLAISEPP